MPNSSVISADEKYADAEFVYREKLYGWGAVPLFAQLCTVRFTSECNQDGREHRPSREQQETQVIGSDAIDMRAAHQTAIPPGVQDDTDPGLQHHYAEHVSHV